MISSGYDLHTFFGNFLSFLIQFELGYGNDFKKIDFKLIFINIFRKKENLKENTNVRFQILKSLLLDELS